MKKIFRYVFFGLMISPFIYFSYSEYKTNPPGTKDLIVIHSKFSNEFPLGYSTSKVRESDYRISNIWHKGDTFILNNSEQNVYLEEVFYSANSSKSTREPSIITIPPGDKYIPLRPALSMIQYVFKYPPRSKTVSGSVSSSLWLHY